MTDRDAFRAIVLFYAFLLIFVPLVRAARGDLPIELSLRGARWEEADAASGALRALDRHVASLAREMQDLGELVGEALGRIAAVEDSVAPPRSDGRS